MSINVDASTFNFDIFSSPRAICERIARIISLHYCRGGLTQYSSSFSDKVKVLIQFLKSLSPNDNVHYSG